MYDKSDDSMDSLFDELFCTDYVPPPPPPPEPEPEVKEEEKEETKPKPTIPISGPDMGEDTKKSTNNGGDGS